MGSNGAIADRIKSARKQKGYSQERLAALVGTSRRHVIRWEQGVHAPTEVYAARLEDVLDTGSLEADPDDEEDSELAADLLRAIERIVKAEAKRIRKGVALGERS